jgi:hypothetical protein
MDYGEPNGTYQCKLGIGLVEQQQMHQSFHYLNCFLFEWFIFGTSFCKQTARIDK